VGERGDSDGSALAYAYALFGIWGMAGVLSVLDLILFFSKTAMLLVE